MLGKNSIRYRENCSEFSIIDRAYFADFMILTYVETHINICLNQPEHPLTTVFTVIIDKIQIYINIYIPIKIYIYYILKNRLYHTKYPFFHLILAVSSDITLSSPLVWANFLDTISGDKIVFNQIFKIPPSSQYR